MTTDAKEKIIDKVRKLLAKAHGTNNEAEAAAFSAKAHEMMMQYELSKDELAVKEQVVIHEEYVPVKQAGSWRFAVACAVARYYLCECIKLSRQRPGVRYMEFQFLFIGRKERVLVTKMMYLYLEETVLRLARAYAKGDKGKHIRFADGCGFGLEERLIILRLQAAKPKHNLTGYDRSVPALYDQAKAENEAAMQALNPKVVKHKQKDATIDTFHGRYAAQDISLNQQIGTDNAKPKSNILR